MRSDVSGCPGAVEYRFGLGEAQGLGGPPSRPLGIPQSATRGVGRAVLLLRISAFALSHLSHGIGIKVAKLAGAQVGDDVAVAR